MSEQNTNAGVSVDLIQGLQNLLPADSTALSSAGDAIDNVSATLNGVEAKIEGLDTLAKVADSFAASVPEKFAGAYEKAKEKFANAFSTVKWDSKSPISSTLHCLSAVTTAVTSFFKEDANPLRQEIESLANGPVETVVQDLVDDVEITLED